MSSKAKTSMEQKPKDNTHWAQVTNKNKACAGKGFYILYITPQLHRRVRRDTRVRQTAPLPLVAAPAHV
jgi:hypothetical protein